MDSSSSSTKEEISTKGKCSIWKRRTKPERFLTLACVLLLLAFFAMIVLVLHLEKKYISSAQDKICNSPMCKFRAGSILINMDFTADPCDDFYQFACGSYMKYQNVYYDETTVTTNLASYMDYIARDELKKAPYADDPPFVEKVKKFYESCLNPTTGVKELVDETLSAVQVDKWPISESQWNSSILFEDAAALSMIYSAIGILFRAQYHPDGSYFEIGKGRLTMDLEVLLKTSAESIKRYDNYVEIMKYTFKKLNFSEEDSNIFANELINFELSLVEIKMKDRNDNSTNTTIAEMQEACVQIDWKEMFWFWYKRLDHPMEYNDKIELDIFSMEYIKDLCQLVGNNKRIVYNALIWNVVLRPLLKFDNTIAKLGDALPEPTVRISEWKMCIVLLPSYLRMGLDYMMLKSLQPEKDVAQVRSYAEQFSEIFDETFSKEDWIDEQTKDLLRMKLKSIKYYIGYSNASLDEEFLNKFFDNLEIGDRYLSNSLRVEKQHVIKNYFNSEKSTHNLVEKPRITKPFRLAAHYNEGTMDRYIVVQMPMLFPPLYHYSGPQYLNFGGIGVIISHEITHAFGHLDYKHKFKEFEETEFYPSLIKSYNDGIDWPGEFLEKYRKRISCFIHQYSNITVVGDTNINGEKTSYENLADNGAVSLNFRAYERYISKHGEEPKLPGLDYNNRQMYFISHAQGWCQTKDALLLYSGYDTHSPGKYRINVPMMNSKEFSETFHCPLKDSKMNPEHKCKMWG